MFKYFYILLSTILFSTNSLAEQKTIGHSEPLPQEQLSSPIRLSCGILISEISNADLNYKTLNKLCSFSVEKFFIFIHNKKLQPHHNSPFVWNISFLPEGSCYRCLNDQQYRFYNRYVAGNVIGYTDGNIHYIFMISNINDPEFNVTFVHEVFHAMSMFYGIYNNHPGNYANKSKIDDVLAEEFTSWLRLGK